MTISLAHHFSYKRLLLFALPNILTMMVISSYEIVDGFFISNFVGKIPFAAVNLFYPILVLIFSFGFMFGTGGAALVSFTQGEGKKQLANEYFTMIQKVLFIVSILCAILVYNFLPSLIQLTGAENKEVIDSCMEYGRVLLLFSPFYTIGQAFGTFLVTAEKPQLTLYIAIITGSFNFVFDYIFIVHFGWGLTGAALATGSSWVISTLLPFIYFLSKNSSTLRLVSCRIRIAPVLKSCSNGLGEVVSVLSFGVITLLMNFRLLLLFGENGVVAFGVAGYTAEMAISISAGYAFAITPVIGYHAGAKNYKEIFSILRKSTVLTMNFGTFLMLSVYNLAGYYAGLFIDYDEYLRLLAQDALEKCAFATFLFAFNVFGPAFFAGMNNGKVAAILSIFQNLIFPALSIFALPFFFGRDAIWFTYACTEFAAFLVLIFCYRINLKSFLEPQPTTNTLAESSVKS